MFPIINIGPAAVQTPGLILLVGLWLGASLAERHASRHGVDPGKLNNLIFLALIAGVVGGRLLYVLQHPQAFASSPISILSLNPGLFDLTGALAVAGLSALVYGSRAGMAFWPTLDCLTSLIAVLAVALAFANLALGEGFGAPSDVPWAIYLWGADRHPTQVYEMLAALLILAFIWPVFKQDLFNRPGTRFLYFLALSAAARLFLEAFRGDSTLLAGGVRSAQVAGWFVLALALYGLHRLRTSQQARQVEEVSPSNG
jgi:phosphatidylglycerol---prolipoprotein diacylglyceryl transferase